MSRQAFHWVMAAMAMAWMGQGALLCADESKPAQVRPDSAEAAPTDTVLTETASPEAQAAEQAPPASEPTQAASAAEAGEPGLVSVDFKDADIRQVLRILSLKSGVDIVAGPDVEGLVSIKLTNVPWEQALDVILRTYGLAYERKGNIVRVLTADAVEKETLATEVYPLSYAKAKEVSELMKEMLTDRGKTKYDERTNTVIVIDLPSTIFQVGQVIKRLDQPTAQVHIDSKIVETTLSKDDNLGIKWSTSASLTAAGAVAPTTFPFPGGAELGNFGSSFIPRATTNPATKGRIPEAGSTFTFGTLTPSSFAVTLNALKQRINTNIISNPTITTLNNKEAFIQVGTDINIPNFQIDPSTGRATVTGVTARPTGIILKVTPYVNQREEIVMDVKPEITSISAITDTFASGISFPRFDVQKASTQVRLVDGQTLVIGGLVKRKVSATIDKVPFLGDIPLVGALFSNRHDATDPHQDLFIFMTVTLVKDAPTEPPKAVAAAQPSE